MKTRQALDRGEFLVALGASAAFVDAWKAALPACGTHAAARAFLVGALHLADPPAWLVSEFYEEAVCTVVHPLHDRIPGGGVEEIPEPPFDAPEGWQIGDGETRAEFMGRVEDYVARVEKWAKAEGLELPPRERDRGNVESGETRWDMLVSRLVDEESYQAIGDGLGISRQAVTKYVRALAARIGVHLE